MISGSWVVRGTVLSAALLLGSCAWLQETAWQEPEFRVLNSELTGLTPTDAQLETRFEVTNPNAFSIALGALDYQLSVNESGVLEGRQSQGSSLAAGAATEITLPLSLNFAETIDLVSGLRGREKLDYRIDAGMSVDIPVAGQRRVPVSVSGEVPIPRIPSVRASNLRLDRLTLSSADLLLTLEVDNPNVFELIVDRFSWEFALNHHRVAGGDARQRMRLEEQGTGMIELPLSVSLAELGRSLSNALINGEQMDYGLSFESDFETGLPQMSSFPFSAVQEGNISLLR